MQDLAKALAIAQAEIKPPQKTRKVDFINLKGQRVKYSYADLADCIEAVKIPLSKNGLSVIQTLGIMENELGFCLKTLLIHSSGQSITSTYPLPIPGTIKPQEFGSALTYARRYSLSAICGFASEDDDDGQIANDSHQKFASTKVTTKKPVPIAKPPKPKNHAPQAAKPDPMPDYEGPVFDQNEPIPDFSEAKQMTFDSPLDELLHVRTEKGLSNEAMSNAIFRVLGEQKRAKDLTPQELKRVIGYVRKFK